MAKTAKKGKENDHSKYQNWIDPASVTPYEGNAKIHDEKQVANIANSIRRFGWQQDTAITTDGVLVIGHGRRLAAVRLGCEMPYHLIDKTADKLTEKDIRELRIADNQTAQETGWDWERLQPELEGLGLEGFDWDLLKPELDPEDEPEAHDEQDGEGGAQRKEIECPHCGFVFEA